MTSKIIAEMSGREVLDAIAADTPSVASVATVLRGYAEIDQAGRQRNPPSPIEVRRMELQAANRILELFGVALS